MFFPSKVRHLRAEDLLKVLPRRARALMGRHSLETGPEWENWDGELDQLFPEAEGAFRGSETARSSPPPSSQRSGHSTGFLTHICKRTPVQTWVANSLTSYSHHQAWENKNLCGSLFLRQQRADALIAANCHSVPFSFSHSFVYF